MINRMIKYIKRKKKRKTFIMWSVMILLCGVTGLSYGVFLVSTSKYRASEMFIANLIYGISLSDADATAEIEGKKVRVRSGQTEVITASITSLNPISSNYKLQYRVNSGSAEVKYSNRTNWMPKGVIGKNGEEVYEKEIKIVITNTAESEAEVEIGASGGYVYNDISEVGLISGYSEVREEAVITTVERGALLTSEVESETECETSAEGYCLYGGESETNYVQYPTSADKSANIWRILGTYVIDGEVVTKLISERTISSNYNEAVVNLNTFYSSLTNKSDYVVNTDKFLCDETLTCRSNTKYSNIGLINVSEYKKVGGEYSYLRAEESYLTLTENADKVSNITKSGIEEVTFDTSSGVRGVVYIQRDVRVEGSGTITDPYIFAAKGDINITSWTVDGEETEEFPTKESGVGVSGITCTNGATGSWNEEEWKLEIGNIESVPVECTIEFVSPLTLTRIILKDNPNVNTRSTFDAIFNESNNGNTIYKQDFVQDGNTNTTYYFAGSVTNNYVKFGQNSNAQDLYWRIVRINEDNSVRLIYAGTSVTDTAAFINSSQVYNINDGNSAYVGYMYQVDGVESDEGVMQTQTIQHGTATSSEIKKALDSWYTNNLETNYEGYISKTAVYCNDRSVSVGTWSPDITYYEGRIRLYSYKTPTFACNERLDRFTVSTGTGNGSLDYPIALITADEVYYAGGYWATSNNAYYISENAGSGSTYWWTITPWDYGSGNANEFLVSSSGNLGAVANLNVSDTGVGVRPVISLKSCVEWYEGDGTSANPYTVSVSDECALKEN